ncbi:hypothetical protein [Streptomyces mirabilis]|uniref:hypothetical protein n=1 Tax=Streptomyces mirabilis TaxID=68239 RepID=UPI0033A18F20
MLPLIVHAVETGAPEPAVPLAVPEPVRHAAELIDTLLAPAVLGRYQDDMDEFRGEAHRILDELGGDETYLSVMRNLVDESSRMLLRADLASEVTVG